MSILLKRRSIRKFKNDPISKELIRELLEGAMSAPSAGNQQPWHFIVLDSREIIDGIQKLHPNATMLGESPLAIVICGDTENERYGVYWVQDCAAATENLLIAISEKELGGVWLGIYPREDRVEGLIKLLNIPKGIIPLSVVAIGYPNEHKPPINRFREEKVHYNKW